MVFMIVTGAHAQSDTLNYKVTSVFDNGGEVEIWYAEENEYNEYDKNWVPWSYRLKKIKLK